MLAGGSRGRTLKQPRAGWSRGARNPNAMTPARAQFVDTAFSVAICLLALRRVPDGPKGPNLSRAAQDAVLLLRGRDPLEGATYRTMQTQMIDDRQTISYREQFSFSKVTEAERRSAVNRRLFGEINTLHLKRLRRDPQLVAHVQWLRGRRELRPVLEAALERLLDAELLPNSG